MVTDTPPMDMDTAMEDLDTSPRGAWIMVNRCTGAAPPAIPWSPPPTPMAAPLPMDPTRPTAMLPTTPAMLITLAMLHTPATPLMPHTLLIPTPQGTGTLPVAMAMLAMAPPLATCTTVLLA